MKNFKVKIILVLGLLFTFACEDYLDIAPEAELEISDVFATQFSDVNGN